MSFEMNRVKKLFKFRKHILLYFLYYRLLYLVLFFFSRTRILGFFSYILYFHVLYSFLERLINGFRLQIGSVVCDSIFKMQYVNFRVVYLHSQISFFPFWDIRPSFHDTFCYFTFLSAVFQYYYDRISSGNVRCFFFF